MIYKCTVKISSLKCKQPSVQFNVNFEIQSVIAWTHSYHYGSISNLAKRLYALILAISMREIHFTI